MILQMQQNLQEQILLGLNKESINKQKDFFVESPINFVTSVIWFLRKYEDGKYCTFAARNRTEPV